MTSVSIPMAEVDRFLVPVGQPGAVRFFLDALFVPQRLRERGAARAARVGLERLLWRRRFAVRSTEHGQAWDIDGPPEWKDALALLTRALQALESDRPEAHSHTLDLRWLLMRERQPTTLGRLVAFGFGQGERPRAVLKSGHATGLDTPLGREAAALWRVAARPELRSSVPEVLAYTTHPPTGAYATQPGTAVEALLLTSVPGRPAYVETHTSPWPGRHVERHFDAAADWLAAAHRALRHATLTLPRADDADAWRQELADTPAGAPDQPWYTELRQRCERSPVALVGTHGDFWPRNLLLPADGGDPRVVDWENAHEAAPPSDDLFDFPLTYGLNYPWSRYRRRPPEDAFRLTFIDTTPVSRTVRRYLERYSAAVGLDRGLLAPLFHYYLMTRAGHTERRALGRETGLWLRFHQLLSQAPRSVFCG